LKVVAPIDDVLSLNQGEREMRLILTAVLYHPYSIQATAVGTEDGFVFPSSIIGFCSRASCVGNMPFIQRLYCLHHDVVEHTVPGS
jgi:hypothetical protein